MLKIPLANGGCIFNSRWDVKETDYVTINSNDTVKIQTNRYKKTLALENFCLLNIKSLWYIVIVINSGIVQPRPVYDTI